MHERERDLVQYIGEMLNLNGLSAAKFVNSEVY